MRERLPELSPASADLISEMMFAAYKALAMVYETACPGKYAAISMMMKEYLADLLRHREAEIDRGSISSEDFEAAVKRVRSMLLTVDEDVIPAPAGL